MKTFLAFFQLIRWGNLLFIALTQVLLYFFIIVPEIQKAGEATGTSTANFFLMVLGTVLIAAGGNVVNDYFDVVADRINKPEKLIVTRYFTKRQALHLHYAFNVLATIIGLYLGWKTSSFQVVSIYVLCAGLLWFYSSTFKHFSILGNLVISFLTAMVVLIVVIFERKIFSGVYTPEMADAVRNILYISGGYATFAFFATLVRELVKDMEDREGDDQVGSKTLAVRWGNQKVKMVVLFLLLIFTAAMMIFIKILFPVKGWSFVLYILLTLLLPTLLLMYQVHIAQSERGFHMASNLVKWIMFFGVSSIPYFYWIENLP